jgi:hypothetical protein
MFTSKLTRFGHYAKNSSLISLKRRSSTTSAETPAKEESFISMIPLKYMVIIAPTVVVSCCAMSLHIEPWRDYLEERYPSLIKFAREFIDFEDALRLVENARVASVEREAVREVQALVRFDNGNSIIVEGVDGSMPFSKFEEGLSGTLASAEVSTNTGCVVGVEFLDAEPLPVYPSVLEGLVSAGATRVPSAAVISSGGCPVDMKRFAGRSSSGGGAPDADADCMSQSPFHVDWSARSLWDEERSIVMPKPAVEASGGNVAMVSSVNGGVVKMSRELADTNLQHYIHASRFNMFVPHMLDGLVAYSKTGALDTSSMRYKKGRGPVQLDSGGSGRGSSSSARQRVEAERAVQALSEQMAVLHRELSVGSQRSMDDILSDIEKLKARRTEIQRKHLNLFYYF